MSDRRRAFLDSSSGERRGVVTLAGLPERLLIERDGEAGATRLGARSVARVAVVGRASSLAFLELPDHGEAVVNLDARGFRPTQGQSVDVEIRAEARRGKSAIARLIGPAEGPPRLVAEGPSIAEWLATFCRVEPVTGNAARDVADLAQTVALQSTHPVAGGGVVTIETTRALTAVDVDLAAAGGAEPKRAARQCNLAAILAAARLLRLKGLGGLVAIDLVGRAHDAPALMAAARAAFAADNPNVAMAPISRFGVLELSIPRRFRPALEALTDEDGRDSALAIGLGLVRALEREAAADGGGRFEAVAAPEVAAAATPALALLRERIGARVAIAADPGRGRREFEVNRR